MSNNVNKIKSFEPNTKLGNVITEQEIENWDSDIIFDCATASGKSTFILNNLSSYCIKKGKRILFLCNRIEIKNEMIDKVKDDVVQVVDIQTYQWLQYHLKKDRNFKLDYDYIACDESSHFLETFDLYTDLSFEYIINHKATKIFMSATAVPLFDYLTSEGYVKLNNYYSIEKDYSYVDSFVLYRKPNSYLDIINHIYETTNDKVIYFTSNLDRAVELFREHPNDSTFYCSPTTSHMEAKEIYESSSNRIEGNTFNTRLLISSRVLDMGITLSDKDVKHIIVDIFDINVLQQCIGRKRLVDDEDKCNIYIRSYNRGQLNLFRNKDIEAMRLFIEDEQLCKNKYYSDREYHNKYIYVDKASGKLKLNKLAYISIEYSEELLDEMMFEEWYTQDDNLVEGKGYEWVLFEKLGVNSMTNSINEWCETEEKNAKMNLIEYLDSIVGKKLFKVEQAELKSVFKENGLSARTMGINTLNGNLKDRGINYQIVSKTGKEKIDGKFKSYRYWELINNVDFYTN